MRIRFAFDPFGPFCSWLMAVGAAFSLYCFIVCQAAADPAAWQHHGIYQSSAPLCLATVTTHIVSKAFRPLTDRPNPSLKENLRNPPPQSLRRDRFCVICG